MATLFGIGTSSLLANQRALATVGHNVANADTEGYSRQRVEFTTQQASRVDVGWLGSGVEATRIQRFYDDFLATQVRSTQSVTAQLETEFDHASRLDNLLGDPLVGLDPAFQDFFDAMQQLSDDPGSAAARQLVLGESESLADRFNYFYQQYDHMRVESTQELTQAVDQVNALAQSIAEINRAISMAWEAGGGATPNDLLDQRETLLNEMSKLVNVQLVEQDDKSINVMIGTGQPLVVGWETTKLVVEANPADPLNPDIALSVGASTQAVTQQVTGGKLGGLLQFRSQYIDSGLNRLGQLAVGLVTSVNAQHTQGIDQLGEMGTSFFQPLSFQGAENINNTGSASVGITFSASHIGDLTTSDYELVFNGGTSYTLTRLADGVVTAIDTSTTIPLTDGFQLTISAGAVAGDSFLIRPTRAAAGSVNLLISDPNRIAAAGALRSNEVTDANGNPVNTGSGIISQVTTGSATGLPLAGDITLTFSADADGSGNAGFTIAGGPGGYILYDPTTADVSGKGFPDGTIPGQFDLYGGLSFEIKGTPEIGDQFVITNNSNATADNRTALALAGIQSSDLLNGGTSTLQEGYSQLVTDVGSRTRHTETNFRSQDGLLTVQKDALLQVSGVNLDEEAASLARFQQAYQASAQVISVANTVFETLLNAVRA